MKKRISGIILILIAVLCVSRMIAMFQTPANSAGDGGPNFTALFRLIGLGMGTLVFSIGGFRLVYLAGRDRTQ